MTGILSWGISSRGGTVKEASNPPTVEQMAQIASEKLKKLNWYQKKKFLATVRVYARACGVRGSELDTFMKQLKRMM